MGQFFASLAWWEWLLGIPSVIFLGLMLVQFLALSFFYFIVALYKYPGAVFCTAFFGALFTVMIIIGRHV